MLVIIAWRNVWRNKARSGVVIGSIVIGIWALSFGGGFMKSFLASYIQSSILHETSNGQIHHPEFSKDQDIKFSIANPEEIIGFLKMEKRVRKFCMRSLVNGMISSSRQATGVRIVGVDADQEAGVTRLDSLISQGQYFSDVSHPALLGEKLRDKLKVKPGAKVILTFQDINGMITAARFRVVGILHSSSLAINETSVFVLKSDINQLLGIPGAVHEIAYTTIPETDDQDLARSASLKFKNVKVESWQQLSPVLTFMQQWMGASLEILIVIIMAALAFGIVNTMLMAVLERVRELGVLMALGMKRSRVFVMIMTETIFLSIAGGPLGLLIGYATISYLGRYDIDLSDYSQGLEAIGYSDILYPALLTSDYLQIMIGVVITAVIASVYPAWKAIQYDPVEAIHSL